MSDKGSERRLFARKLMKTKVVFDDEFGNGVIYLFSEDISTGGLLISGEIPIKIGSYVLLSFRLPESSVNIRATGEVVRVQRRSGEEKKGASGMGIRFVGLSGDSFNIIREYIG